MYISPSRWQHVIQVLLILVSLIALSIVAQDWLMGGTTQDWAALILVVGALILFAFAHLIAERIVSGYLDSTETDELSRNEATLRRRHRKVKRRLMKESYIDSLPQKKLSRCLDRLQSRS